MSDKKITNEDLAAQINNLQLAVVKGFATTEKELAAVNRRLDLLDERVGVLEAQHKEVVTRIEQVPDGQCQSKTS